MRGLLEGGGRDVKWESSRLSDFADQACCVQMYTTAYEAVMSRSTTLTIRVPAELRDRLDDLAERTRRTRSFLAGEAVAGYVERELEIIAAVEQGLESASAGRLIDHDDVFLDVESAIRKASGEA